MKVPADGFGGFPGDHGGKGFNGGLLHIAKGAKVSQEALAGLCANTGDVQQFGAAVAHGAALAVVADGEAVALVADHLDEMEHRRAAVEDDGLVFRAVEIDDLLLFGDGGERLRGDAEDSRASAAAWSWPRPPSMRMSEGMFLGSLAGLFSGAADWGSWFPTHSGDEAAGMDRSPKFVVGQCF